VDDAPLEDLGIVREVLKVAEVLGGGAGDQAQLVAVVLGSLEVRLDEQGVLGSLGHETLNGALGHGTGTGELQVSPGIGAGLQKRRRVR